MDWSNITTTPNYTTAITSQVPHHVKSYPVPVIVTSAVSCALSIIGSVVIFATFVYIPGIRNFTRQLILCLTAADFLTCSGYLVSVVRYLVRDDDAGPLTCKIQSALTTYSSLVSFFLTIIIAFHLFLLVFVQYDRLTSKATLVIYNVTSWGIPGIIIFVAVVYGALGPDMTMRAGTGPWCWVDSRIQHTTFWMLITGKFWEILCYLLTSSFYVLLKFHLCRQNRIGLSEIHQTLRDEDKNFLYVWLFLYLVRIWGTTRFFLFTYDVHAHCRKGLMKMLLYLQAAGDPSQAFVNSILFCLLDKTVRRELCCTRSSGNVKNDEGVIESERTALIQNEAASGSPHESVNSDYGTGNSSHSHSTSSELEVMADRI